MDKPVYIHLGPYKTGTTALQHFLTINEAALAENGFRYLKSSRYYDAERKNVAYHHALAWVLYHKHYRTHLDTHDGPFTARRDQILDEVSDEISHAADQCIVISSEVFTLLRADAIDELLSLFSNRPIKAVLYVRDFHQQAMSMAAQWVKENALGASLTNVYDHIHFMYSFYMEWLNVLSRKIGKTNIIFRKYGTDHFVNGNIYQDFLDALGIKQTHSFAFPDELLNVSMTCCESITFKEIMNRLGMAIPNRLLVDELLKWEKCHSGTKFFLPASITSKINKDAEEIHSLLARNYLDTTYSPLFGGPLSEDNQNEFRLSYVQFISMIDYLEQTIPNIKQHFMDSLLFNGEKCLEYDQTLIQFEATFRKFIDGKKAVALWGCGDIADKMFEKHKFLRDTPFYVVDKSPAKHGSLFRGREVLAPTCIEEAGVDTVIIASSAVAGEIAKEIEESHPGVRYILRLTAGIALLERRDQNGGGGGFELKEAI